MQTQSHSKLRSHSLQKWKKTFKTYMKFQKTKGIQNNPEQKNMAGDITTLNLLQSNKNKNYKVQTQKQIHESIEQNRIMDSDIQIYLPDV